MHTEDRKNKSLHFDTIASMLAAQNVRDGEVAFTKRYSTAHTVGDGSGGEYVYDADSTATIDGGFVMPGVGGSLSFSGTTFNGTAGTGRWLLKDTTVVWALKHGVIPGGTTDTTTEVRRVIDLHPGRVIDFQNATLLVSDPGSGAGYRDRTAIYLSDSHNDSRLQNGRFKLGSATSNPAYGIGIFAIGADVTGIVLDNITVDGTTNSANWDGIISHDSVSTLTTPNAVRYCQLSNVTVTGVGRNGVDLAGDWHVDGLSVSDVSTNSYHACIGRSGVQYWDNVTVDGCSSAGDFVCVESGTVVTSYSLNHWVVTNTTYAPKLASSGKTIPTGSLSISDSSFSDGITGPWVNVIAGDTSRLWLKCTRVSVESSNASANIAFPSSAVNCSYSQCDVTGNWLVGFATSTSSPPKSVEWHDCTVSGLAKANADGWQVAAKSILLRCKSNSNARFGFYFQDGSDGTVVSQCSTDDANGSFEAYGYATTTGARFLFLEQCNFSGTFQQDADSFWRISKSRHTGTLSVSGSSQIEDQSRKQFADNLGNLGATATIDFNASTGDGKYGTLTANTAITFSGTRTGEYWVKLTQDGTGGHNPTFPNIVNSPPTINATANAETMLRVLRDELGQFWCVAF